MKLKIRKSPFGLLQEDLNKNSWKIFVCCIFCNLTKRKSAEPYFWEVLKRWPTPEKLANADEFELASLIQPLGLSQKRSRALKRMSYEFIHKDWQNDPTSLYGIGKYAHDAYRIFCLNEWKDVEPKDGALINYVNWRRENEHVRIR
jgi:methyl-CpG-binding domain protein 4